METAAQREERIEALEQRRATHASSVWPGSPPDEIGTSVVEIAPGRGDLNYSSQYLPAVPTALSLIGSRAVSFARLFQTQPWVAAAVMRMMTWAVRVPLKAYKRKDDPFDREVVENDHPLAEMIGHPWDRGSAAQLIMNLLGPVLVHGNSTLIIDDTARSGRIQLEPKDWRYCNPIMPWRDSIEGFRFDTDTPARTREVSVDKVLHIAWWSPTGPIGTSPLQQLGTTVTIEDAAQRYQKSLFLWGGRPATAVVASEAFLELKPSERAQIMTQLRADMTAIYGTPENSGKPALLPPGLDWKAIGQTTVEAALIDQRKVAREEICGVYMIPPPMLGILEKATYSNIDAQKEMIYTDCLGPPLILIEQALNSQLIRDLLQDDEIFFEFDFAAVLRGDRLKEIEGIRNAVQSALLSPNEGRNVLGRPSVDEEEMDQYWMPTNNVKQITGEVADALKDRVLNPPPVPPVVPGAPPAPGQPPRPPGQQAPPPPPPPIKGSSAPTLEHDSGKLHVVSGGREYVLEPR